jgi:hypothetical protein
LDFLIFRHQGQLVLDKETEKIRNVFQVLATSHFVLLFFGHYTFLQQAMFSSIQKVAPATIPGWSK